MEHITVEELDPGVILEVTKPNGKTYQYKKPTKAFGDGFPDYRGKEVEIDVFYSGGVGNRYV